MLIATCVSYQISVRRVRKRYFELRLGIPALGRLVKHFSWVREWMPRTVPGRRICVAYGANRRSRASKELSPVAAQTGLMFWIIRDVRERVFSNFFPVRRRKLMARRTSLASMLAVRKLVVFHGRFYRCRINLYFFGFYFQSAWDKPRVCKPGENRAEEEGGYQRPQLHKSIFLQGPHLRRTIVDFH